MPQHPETSGSGTTPESRDVGTISAADVRTQRPNTDILRLSMQETEAQHSHQDTLPSIDHYERATSRPPRLKDFIDQDGTFDLEGVKQYFQQKAYDTRAALQALDRSSPTMEFHWQLKRSQPCKSAISRPIPSSQ